MTTLSVPITSKQEEFINEQVKSGKAGSKAHVVRYALQRLAEEEAIDAVLRAEREIDTGKGVRGDLKKLLKKI